MILAQNVYNNNQSINNSGMATVTTSAMINELKYDEV